MTDASVTESEEGPEATARSFVEAITWGEHGKIWDLLGIEARTTIFKVATARGMDEGLAARLRDGTATGGEREEFLADLVNGLRADLAGNDLDALEYEVDGEPQEEGRARVVLNIPLPPAFGGYLPVGSVELATEGGKWQVARLVPQVTR